MRGRHLKREIKIIGKWRETKDLSHFSIQADLKGTFKQNLKDIKPENAFPLFLNLVSCFLFMMNNYIIEPSSAYYAEALGSSDGHDGWDGSLVCSDIEHRLLLLDKLQLQTTNPLCRLATICWKSDVCKCLWVSEY